MFERFTDRARKVMEMGNQEAQKLNHEFIGTEHLLLGLVIEGSGVGANVLKNLDIDLRVVKKEVLKILTPGPEMVTMGKLPQTPRARKVIEFAVEEARALNHNYVGTEHLLLGLIRENQGVAAQVLSRCGITLERAKEEVIGILGETPIAGHAAAAAQTTPPRDVTDLVELFGLKLDAAQKAKFTESMQGQPAIKIDCPFSDPKFLQPSIEAVATKNPEEYLRTLPPPLAKFIVCLCTGNQYRSAFSAVEAIFPPAIKDYFFPATEADEHNPGLGRFKEWSCAVARANAR
jgi:hypothetical protein